MKMNTKMSALLGQTKVQVPLIENEESESIAPPTLTLVDNSVLLKQEYEHSRHAKLADFPDRTGFECFINHVHFPFTGTRESLTSCLSYAFALRRSLAHEEGRGFQVIISVAEGECTVRFHQRRPNENWISKDLEGYESEAILILDAGPLDKLF